MTNPFNHGPVTALIQKQLATAFIVLCLMLTAMAGIAIYGLYYINTQAHDIVTKNNEKLALANTMLDALQTRRYSLFIYAQLEDPFDREEIWEEFNDAASTYLSARTNIRNMPLPADEMQALDRLDELTQAGQPKQLKVISLVEQDAFDEARQYLLTDARPAQDQVISQIKHLVDIQKQLNHIADLEAGKAYSRTITVIAIMAILLLVFGFILAVTIIKSTARKSSEVEYQQRKFKALFEASHDAVMLWDNARLMIFNEAAEQIFQLDHSSVSQLCVDSLLPRTQENGDPTSALFYSAIEESERAANGVARLELMLYKTDKTPFPAELHISVIQLDNQRILQTVIRDISDRKKAEEEISWLAYYDPITELPNESLFYDRLQMSIDLAERSDTSVALLSIKIDYFDMIKDSFGRDVAHEMLAYLGKAYTQVIEDGDTVARSGTSEFSILLSQIESDIKLNEIAERISETTSSPYTIGDHLVHPKCHIGISRFPEHGKTANKLLEHARVACKQIIDIPHKTVNFYDPTSHRPAFRELSLANSILSGIENNEFFVVYQPKYTTSNRQINGVEALCRWQHPQYGLIMPDEFIPLAEDNGSIIQLGLWVLNKSLEEIQMLEASIQDELCLAVNLSIQQCYHEDIVDQICGILDHYRSTNKLQLELEITESLPSSGDNHVIDAVKTLRSRGIQIAIDDFGTGYSGLSQIHDMPVDVLKIDKSFVMDLEDNNEHREIISMIISLGHRLGLKIVAEGVESQIHYDYLTQKGCDVVQGFHLGKPMTLNELMIHMGLKAA